MTLSLYITNITNAIASLNVTGVTFVDYDGIVADWKAQPNVFYMIPENPITDGGVSYPTVLKGANAPEDITYTLNYRFLGTQVGSIGGFTKGFVNAFEKAHSLKAKLIDTDAPYSGKVNMSVSNFDVGPKEDPSGNRYFGADISLTITEQH